jgi:gluconate 2-dehydrogenase gamma chain
MSISRRAALTVLGAATLPSVLRADSPGDEAARALMQRIERGATQGALFRADERATISAIADAVLPRTETPGALDVGVPAFVELIATDWMTEAERTAFREGLAALDAHAVATAGRAWPSLDAAARVSEAAWAEGAEERALPAKAAFRRLKGLTVQGWFSSERVQKEVLRTNIAPGRYLGCAPIPAPPPGDDAEAREAWGATPGEIRYLHEGLHEGHHDA